MYLHPVAISVAIIVAVVFVGAFLAYFRDRKKYDGHQEYAADARSLANKLNGEIFRDGEDLVINGTQGQSPVVIRLSFAENTPGLHIRMVAPANFRMFVLPKGARTTEGRVQVRTADDSFEARFVTRTDNPTQAKMYLGSKGVLPELGKLGCLSKGYVTFTTGAIEQSEALVPVPNTGQHIHEHLQSMERLVKELGRMPFADRVELKPLQRERRLVLKASIVAGIIAALVGIITAAQQPQELPLPSVGSQAHLAEGVMPNDALVMGSLTDWRAATTADLDPDAAAWARAAGQKETGRLTLNIGGASKNTKDIVYLLVNEKDGQRRIILLADGKTRYDVKYSSSLGLLAVIPKANLSKVQWLSRKPEDPDGDGLLLIRKPEDRASGLVLYFSDGKLVSGVPSDYQSINLLE
jgi:hypothetical protein